MYFLTLSSLKPKKINKNSTTNYRTPIRSTQNEESSLPQSPTHVEHDEANANMNHDNGAHDNNHGRKHLDGQTFNGHIIHHDYDHLTDGHIIPHENKHDENVICVGSHGQNCHDAKDDDHEQNSDEKGSETLPMDKPNDGYYIPENLWNWFWNQTHTKVIL